MIPSQHWDPSLVAFIESSFISEFKLSEKASNAWKTPGPKEARGEKPYFKQLSSSVSAHRYMASLCSWVTIIEPNSFSYSNSSNSVYFLEYLGSAQPPRLNAHNASPHVWACPNMPCFCGFAHAVPSAEITLPWTIMISPLNSTVTSTQTLPSPCSL